MFGRIIVIIGLLLASAEIVRADGDAISASEILASTGQARVGAEAPWLAGWTLDDEVFNIRTPFDASTEVERLVVVFWATWCVPCRVGLDRLARGRDEIAASAAAVVLVNVGERPDVVAEFFGDAGAPWPVLLDPYRKTCETWIVRSDGGCALPLTAVVTRDGLVERLVGAEGDDYPSVLLSGAR